MHLVAVGDEEYVREIHRSSNYVNDHLTGAGDGVRHLLDGDIIR